MYDATTVSAPTRYGVLLAIMQEYGWSWRDLCEAPADLVEEIAMRITAERHWNAERSKKDAAFAQAKSMLG
jgi:hypothetical protein